LLSLLIIVIIELLTAYILDQNNSSFIVCLRVLPTGNEEYQNANNNSRSQCIVSKLVRCMNLCTEFTNALLKNTCDT